MPDTTCVQYLFSSEEHYRDANCVRQTPQGELWAFPHILANAAGMTLRGTFLLLFPLAIGNSMQDAGSIPPMLAMLTTEGVLSRNSCTVCSSSGDSSDALGLGACEHQPGFIECAHLCQAFAWPPSSHCRQAGRRTGQPGSL